MSSPSEILEDARYPFDVYVEEMAVYVTRQSPLCYVHKEVGGALGDPSAGVVMGLISPGLRDDWIAMTIEQVKNMVREESRRRAYCVKCEWWRNEMATGEQILARCIQSRSR